MATSFPGVPPESVSTSPASQGGQASELAVQNPTKFDLLINLKPPQALGLEVAADPPRARRRGDRMKRREFIRLLGRWLARATR